MNVGLIEDLRVDRGAIERVPLTARSNDRAYWLSKTPEERFEALEILRQIAYGYDPSTARLQRVFEVAQFETR